VSVTLTRTDDTFGVQFIQAGDELVVAAVDETASATGLRAGLRLVDLLANGIEHDCERMRLRTLQNVLGRHKCVTLICSAEKSSSPSCSGSLMALDVAVSHEDSPVLTIRRLLTPSEVAQVHAAAAELRQKQKPHAYDNVLINAASDDRPFGLAPSHESLFLHEGGFFARACPEVWCVRGGSARRPLSVTFIALL